MKIYADKNITLKELDSVTCDICGHEIKKDSMEFQEYVNIKKEFGYGSNCFGDNATIDIDFCEKCIYDIIEEKGLKYLIKSYYPDEELEAKDSMLKIEEKLDKDSKF